MRQLLMFGVIWQSVPVGQNMVKISTTKATAVKEKEGKLMCQAEVLCEGERRLQLAEDEEDLKMK